MSSLSIDIWVDDDETSLVLIGELDLATVGQFLEAMESATDHGKVAVVVDARGLTFCDSVGLRGLMSAPSRGPLALRPSDALERLLKMTQTEAAFHII